MRILQIVHEFPPDAWAGTELVTLQLSRALRERGHEVIIATRVADPAAEEFSVREEQRYGFHVFALVNNYTKTTRLQLTYDNDFFDEVFTRLLTQARPDIVHFQHVAHLSARLIAIATGQGYPTVLSLHDFYFACHLVHLIDLEYRLCAGPERGERCVACLQKGDPTGAVRARFPFMAHILQLPDAVLAPSQFLARRMTMYFPALESRLRVSPLGVDLVNVERRARPVGAPLRLLCAGALIPHKGANLLLEALQELPGEAFEVSLYGSSDPYWQPYIARLHELATGLSVHFGGVYPHDELGSILARHDVLVMPGICEETFSLLTREAMLAGLPVIAARHGALPEAVRDGENGLLFEPGNVVDLRRCLARFLEQPELLPRLRDPRPQIKSVAEYAGEIEAVYRGIGSDAFRAQTLRQRTMEQYEKLTTLQRQTSEDQVTIADLRARQEAMAQQVAQLTEDRQDTIQARDRALADVRSLTSRLQEREAEVQEREARLNAIYASTTWKLYRVYLALLELCVRRPLRWWRERWTEQG